jgi:CO/xanthine dehydrogenase FAD-binding subunit
LPNAHLARIEFEGGMTYLRRLTRFAYLAPRSVDEACDLLAAHGKDVRLLAGGTDLLLQMRRRETTPAYVIGLKGMAELSGMRALADGGVAIGAMTTMRALLTSSLIRRNYGVLAEAAAGIGGPELRNVATIGGNVAGALPCADLPPTLIALGAKVRLKSRDGERVVPVEDLYPQFGQTVARADELLTTIELPSVPSFSGGVYLKFHDRQSMDMTTVGVSAFVTWDEASRVFRDVKIALASSAPVPMRARKAEAVLRGRACGEDVLEQAASAVCEEANPRTSWRATREFRFELLRSLTKRAVRSARDKAAIGGAP